MKMTNFEMENCSHALEELLDHKDIVGYAAARNLRMIQNAASEYFDIRNELVNKYGEQEFDEEGNPTGRFTLKIDSPNFLKFSEEIAQYGSIEHDVDIYKVPVKEVIGLLTGTQILMYEWMIEEE